MTPLSLPSPDNHQEKKAAAMTSCSESQDALTLVRERWHHELHLSLIVPSAEREIRARPYSRQGSRYRVEFVDVRLSSQNGKESAGGMTLRGPLQLKGGGFSGKVRVDETCWSLEKGLGVVGPETQRLITERVEAWRSALPAAPVPSSPEPQP